MSSVELMKLFDFILENKNIIISNNGLFSRDTLIMIRAIIKGKITNNFELSQFQKQLLIEAFIKSNNYFTEDTPEFIVNNDTCMKLAIERNINSVNYIQQIPVDMQKYIIDKILENKFVLKAISPSYLKSNYDVALKSIKLDGFTADYIIWEEFTENQINNLVNEAVNNGYILSSKSCVYLTENKIAVLQSIKKDMDNIKYASESIKHHPEVFKYLLLNGYPYSNAYIRNRPINYFLDNEVMKYYFKQNKEFDKSNEKYISRFVQLYNDALNAFPSIKTFKAIFQMVAEVRWKEHKKEKIDYYENIFGKICTQLRNNNDFDIAVSSMDFIDQMESELEEKFYTLYENMKEYFNIFHSNVNNKLEKLESSQNIIAKLSALYISKSKEEYKKKELDEYYEWIKPYFTLRLDHPLINKKIIQSKKKEKFKNLYQHDDEEVTKFLNELARKYSELLDPNTVTNMINNFILLGYSKIDDFTSVPYNYSDYERYEKAIKLIHRLNSGYIKYNGIELINYKDIIKLNEKKQEYVYTGITFDKEDLEVYKEYRKKERIFEKIKKDIILKVKTVEIDEYIDPYIIESLSTNLPFTDEYFIFNSKFAFENFSMNDLLNDCLNEFSSFKEELFLSDDAFSNIYNMVINNGLIWLLLFISRNKNHILYYRGINKDDIFELINNMIDITKIAKKFNFDLSNFSELVLVNGISKCADSASIAILGKEIIEKLYKFKDYTNEEEETIISMAKELVCQMTKRSKSTVPYVSGQTMNYRYSIYDSQDETLLLAGINTDACFRIDGNDNDFLHYCALDKNGFVIKITDVFGNFIGRGSGFRNGNCVFINQLRTIYDEGGNYYNGEYENEKNDIIETFKKACEDIVSTSQKNPNEKDKIDHVFVTRSYSLQKYDSNVSDEINEKIGDNPMDNESEDWREFVENTNNLRESKDADYFETDYGDYSLICMASSKKIERLKARDIKPKNIEALYDRTRNQIIVTTDSDSQVIRKINKISGVKYFFENNFFEPFKPVEVPKHSLIFVGDNWYIIFKDRNIISSCILEFDHKAQSEFNLIINTLNQYVQSSQEQFSIENVIESLKSQNSNENIKILKLHL